MQYFHLIYYSTAQPKLTQVDLSEILVASRRENLKNEITGFLIYRDEFFLQLLEGDEIRARETVSRIEKDSRHSSVTVIGEFKSISRIMPDWSMALVDSNKTATSAKAFFDLLDNARGKSFFDSREAFELVLKKFSKVGLSIPYQALLSGETQDHGKRS
jgi:hypothetical protein